MSAFINEIHYDNAGSDVGEFIEIAAPAGFDLTGWSLVLYNGSNGATYNTVSLNGLTVADSGNGFGFATLDLPTNGLQNGAPDGIALVDNLGAVTEFLSYEGVLTAVDGPAEGYTSTDIGVLEASDSPIGFSLQRQTDGTSLVFAAPQAETPGAQNTGQTLGSGPILPPLVINEILADPASDLAGDANGDGTRSATQDEFVEIVNTGDTEIDLSGMTVSDVVVVRHTFADGTTLAAGAAIIVFGGGAPTGDFGGAQVVTASTGSLGLNNGGDTVTLATADGDTIADLTYGSEGGGDESLTRDPDLTGSFTGHSVATGSGGALFSPGTQNDGTPFIAPPPPSTELTVNEIHADPDGDLTGDANGDGVRSATDDEFVEIVNTGSADVDISGVTIADGVQLRHTFADGTILAAGAAIIVFGGGTPTGDFGGAIVVTASTGSLGLNNGGDTVTIAASDGTIIEQVAYGSEGGNNQSITRDPELMGAFVQHTTANDANGARFSPGTNADGTPFIAPAPVFTINEVDTDQAGTDEAEFIEIYDGGIGNVSLDELVVALFNGSDDVLYDSIELDGFSTDADGFFVIGSENVANVDFVAFNSNGLQNGADAVALYEGDLDTLLTNNIASTNGLLDAVVYDTNDADDAGLLAALGQSIQYNEGASNPAVDSLSRSPDGSGDFITQAPTPGATNVVAPPVELTLISEIQGSGGTENLARVGIDDLSPLNGQTVTVEAIVTADFQDGLPGEQGNLGGFYIQEEEIDYDFNDLSSEGIFIFDGALPDFDVNIGDLVEVTGTVGEFFGQTQISATAVALIAPDQLLPTAVEVAFPTATVAEVSDGEFVANLEAYEGMLVNIPQDMTISEMFNLDRFGQYNVSADGRPFQFTQQNDPDVAGFAQHQQDIAARTLALDDGQTGQNPDPIQVIDGNDGVLTASDSFRMGDTLSSIEGVINYSFGEFRIQSPTGNYAQTNPRDEQPEDIGGNFTVASLNVLNYFTTIDLSGATTDNGSDPRGADTPEEFERQAQKLVNAIVEIDADVLGLIELENDFAGDTFAIKDLVERVNAELGSEVYAFADPGQEFVGGDAIANGLIYKVDEVGLNGDMAILETFEGRDFVDPLAAGRGLNRPAIAQTFEDLDTGQTLTIAVNHLKSKGSLSGLPEDEAQGDGQGNNNATRTEAADILADWLASDPTGQGSENTLIVGDLNAYAKEDPLTTLAAAGYTDIATDRLGEDAYSFVFDGQFGTLDYVLANEALNASVTGVTEWHINSDEADAIDYNLDFGRNPSLFTPDTPARNSDHDPVIVSFQFEPVFNMIAGTKKRDVLDGTNGRDQIEGFNGNDLVIARADDDFIDAGRGNDIVFAGSGDDTVIAGNGRNDKIFGGEGEDTFIFSAELAENSRRDKTSIYDFDVNEDMIDLGGAEISSVREFQSFVRISLDGGHDQIRLWGVDEFDDISFANDLAIV